MKIEEIETGSDSDSHAMRAYWEACRRLSSAAGGLEDRPTWSDTPRLYKYAIELAIVWGRTQATPVEGLVSTKDRAAALRLQEANDRANELLRRATAILSDIQKKDGEIAAVLDAFSAHSEAREQYDEYPFPDGPQRCTTYRRRIVPPGDGTARRCVRLEGHQSPHDYSEEPRRWDTGR